MNYDALVERITTGFRRAQHSLNSRHRRVRFCLAGCTLMIVVPLVCGTLFMVVYLLFPPDPVDIVVLGVDARPGERYLTRTDSVMLVNISPGSLSVTMLSISRDVFINVPGYGEQRINTINVLGEQEAEGHGPALVKASMQESFGVEVDRYARLDFQGFVAVVDAVGGIDIDVPKLIIDYDYPTLDGGTMTVQFDPGRQHMNGERALQYARTRHQDDDFQRSARQQQVVEALVSKLTGPAGLVYGPQVWQALHEHTDTDLSVWDALRVGPGLLLGWRGREQRTLQRDDLIAMKAGYWRLDYDRIAPWIERHFD